ncbi:hypothetical protein JOD54_001519 [Actinokineospora baliensis]|uniref:effector-associated constant component EACC1 n=1 Tax=Actinokineospora baliensis TaxID=547056 RepID=UPI0027DADD2B|nr:hypothetical protein [Actinokineospora baliensis]MBM7771315.1 hypothetical protein [Actinokineospora baliensis]
MHLLVTAEGDTADLWRWLSNEEDLRGRVRIRPGPVQEGTLGAELVIAAAIAAAPVVADSVLRFLTERHRQRHSDLELTVEDPSGRVRKLRVQRTTDAGDLVRFFVGEPEPPAVDGVDASFFGDDDAPTRS